jgi:hypothetical protein
MLEMLQVVLQIGRIFGLVLNAHLHNILFQVHFNSQVASLGHFGIPLGIHVLGNAIGQRL